VVLLEGERSGESRIVPLLPDCAVYVPGHAAHRTMNTGRVPLTYIGVYPARAGHDCATIVRKNFRYVVVERNGVPVLKERKPR
jgi:glucose-6-phosphate isomerase